MFCKIFFFFSGEISIRNLEKARNNQVNWTFSSIFLFYIIKSSDIKLSIHKKNYLIKQIWVLMRNKPHHTDNNRWKNRRLILRNLGKNAQPNQETASYKIKLDQNFPLFFQTFTLFKNVVDFVISFWFLWKKSNFVRKTQFSLMSYMFLTYRVELFF